MKIWPYFVALAWLNNATAEESIVFKQAISLPSVFISSASDDFHTNKYQFGYYPLYGHGDLYTGLTIHQMRFSQNDWHLTGNQITILTKSISPETGLGYDLNLGVNKIDSKELLTTDSRYSFQWAAHTSSEISINRDWVETQSALTQHIYYTQLQASVEQLLADRLTLIASAGATRFSDTNTRIQARLKLIYSLVPDQGITTQLRYRDFRNRDTDITNNYFNPDRYQEAMIAIGIRRWIQGWTVKGLVGVGQQRINKDSRTTTKLFEFEANSPFVGKVFFRTRIGYSNSAGFQGPDYAYRYFMGELIFPFY